MTAGDLVGAPNIGVVLPGKRNLVQTLDVGDEWIDHGAKCDGKDDTTFGCFMSDPQRLRLIIDFKDRVQTAQANYKFALTDMRVDKLLKKEDDLNWVLSLALDLAGTHFLSVAVKALKSVKTNTLTKLSEAGLDAARGVGEDPGKWARRVEDVMTRISDDDIKGTAKIGFDFAKKGASKSLESALNRGDSDDKQISLSYIAQLMESCDEGFMNFAGNVTGRASDAELVVLWEGMHPHNHTPAHYKTALTAKLEAYKRSGVENIGRRVTLDREFHAASVRRETRVVWVKTSPGDRKLLMYESQEGDFDPTYVEKDDPGTANIAGMHSTSPRKFAVPDPRETSKLERLVPAEFQEAAIARSEQIYGPTQTLDSRDWWRRYGIDTDAVDGMNKQPQQQVPKLQLSHDPDAPSFRLGPMRNNQPTQPAYPAGSVFNNQPTQPTYPAGSVFNKPSEPPFAGTPSPWDEPSSVLASPKSKP